MSLDVNAGAPPDAPPDTSSGGAAGPGPALRLTRLDGARRLLGVGLAQVIGLQVAVTAGLVAAGPPGHAPAAGLRAGAGAVAVGCAVLVLGRRDGRWWTDRLVLRARWLVRRRRYARVAAQVAAAGPPAADVTAVLPGVQVHGFVDRAARRHGLVFDGQAWTAVLAAAPVAATVDVGPVGVDVPLGPLVAGLDERGVRLRTVQVITVSVPVRARTVSTGAGSAAPGAVVPPAPAPAVAAAPRPTAATAPAAPIGPAPPTAPAAPTAAAPPVAAPTAYAPARRRTYLALTLDPAFSREAALARGGGPEGARRALAAAAGRMAARLMGAGLEVSVLDVEQARLALRTCLATLTAPARPASGGQAEHPEAAEAWTGWQVADAVHVGYRVTRWADGAAPLSLLDAVAAVPALAVVSSLSLCPTRLGVPGVSATVRFAVREGERATTDAAVRRAAAAAGGRVERLDGEHLPAVLATLPVGGVR